MARSLPENGDAVRMPLLGFPGPGAGKGMASCHAFSAVHAAIRVSRMAVRHAAWTDNGRGFSWEAGGPVSRILAWEWRGIASRTGQPGRDGRKLLVCMIEAVEILKVKRLYRTYC